MWIVVRKVGYILEFESFNLGLKSVSLLSYGSEKRLTLDSNMSITTVNVSPPAHTRLREADYDVLKN